MNFKTTALLLMLLLGSAGLYLGTRGGSGPAADPGASSSAIGRPLVIGTTFRRLVIEHGDGGAREAYQLEDGVWWQVQPVRFPVDAAGPESVINAALALAPRQQLTPRRPGDANSDLEGVPTRADLGLGPGADRVVIVSGETVSNLVLGRREVAGTAWLAVDGDTAAFLVDPTLHDAAAAADPAAWRPTRLPGPAADTVGGLALKQRGRPAVENAVLHRGPAGWSWGPARAAARIGDDPARADRDAANRLAAAADGLPIRAYVTDDPDRLAELGLADPAATLTLRPAAVSPDPAPAPGCTLRLGRPADAAHPPARYATASFTDDPSPVVFVVSGAEAAPMLADPSTLRDPRLVVADPASVRGLRVDRVGVGAVELAHAGGSAAAVRFVEPDPDAAADDRWGVDWLTLLHRTRAAGFTSAPPEAQGPVATATLRLAADRVERVRLYRDRDGGTDVMLAVREDEPVAAVVPAETLAPLLAPAITLRDTRLPAPGGVDTVRLTRDDGVVFGFSGIGGDAPRLRVGDAELTPAERWDIPAARRLGDWLRAPRAVQWTPRAELPRGPVARLSTGPDDPAYSVNVGQNLAQRTDLPGVFRIASDVAELFDAEYRPRVLIDARADELTSVGLRGPSGDISPDAEPPGLRDRLAGLRAERWLAAPREGPDAPGPAAWSLRIEAGPRDWTLERAGDTGWRSDGAPVRLSDADAEAIDAAVAAWSGGGVAVTPSAP